MITDVVCEKIVAKKFELLDALILVAEIIGLLALVFGSVLVAGLNAMLSIVPVIVLAIAVYLIIKLVKGIKTEYEYDFVNGDLTIDKIINMSDRKFLFSMDVHDVDKIGDYDGEKYDRSRIDSFKCFAARRNPDNAIFMEYKDKEGKRCCVVIEKDEKILDALRRCVAPSVYREGFRR